MVGARYRLDLYETDKTTRLHLLEPGVDLESAAIDRQLGAIDRLELAMYRASGKWADVTPGRWVAVVDSWPTTPTTRWFQLAQSTGEHQADGRWVTTFSADHWAGALVDTLVRERALHIEEDPTTLLTALIANSSATGTITVADAPTSPRITYQVDYPTLLAAIQDIAGMLVHTDGRPMDWWLDDSGGVHIARRGSSRTEIWLVYGGEVQGLTREVDRTDMGNRYFMVGGGDPPPSVEDHEHLVTVVNAEDDIGVEACTLIPSDSCYVYSAAPQAVRVKITRGPGAGNSARINDTMARTDAEPYDRIQLMANLTDVTANESYIKLENFSSGATLDYREDTASITANGVAERPFRNQEYLLIENLVRTNPFLSGTYTGGLCDGWTEVGTPTTTENTTAAYIQYGTKSQKVVADAADEGIYQAVTLEVGAYYAVKLNVYVTSGAVRLEFYNGDDWLPPSRTPATTSETGTFIELTIELGFETDVASDTDGSVRVVAHEGAATFYVDAVQVTKGIGAPQKFVSGHDADNLYREGYGEFLKKRTPRTTYRLETQLYSDQRAARVAEALTMGDVLTIVDDHFSVLEEAAVLVSDREELLNPAAGRTMEFDSDRMTAGGFYARMARAQGQVRGGTQMAQGGTDRERTVRGDDRLVTEIVNGVETSRSFGNYQNAKVVYCGTVGSGDTFLANLVVPTGRKVVAMQSEQDAYDAHPVSGAGLVAQGLHTYTPGNDNWHRVICILYEAADEGDPPAVYHAYGLAAGTYANLRAWWSLQVTAGTDYYFKGTMMLVEVNA